MLLIRHLPTVWNKEGRLQGSIDNPIDEAVIGSVDAEIRKNLQCIAESDTDRVVVSELRRTHETAIAYGFHEFEVESLINELNYGRYEGQQKLLFQKDYGEKWLVDPLSITDLGEPLRAFQDRLIRFLKEYDSQNVLVFAHGTVMRGLLSIRAQGDIQRMNRFEVKNNELIKF